jgi:hypothetical protein
MRKPNTRRVAAHFGVPFYRINQDLASEFLSGCIPAPRNGVARRWDEKAFIAAHFYFNLQRQGMGRKEASKIATEIAMFAERSPDEKTCATMIAVDGDIINAMIASDVPHIGTWKDDIVSVSVHNIHGARLIYRKLSFDKSDETADKKNFLANA